LRWTSGEESQGKYSNINATTFELRHDRVSTLTIVDGRAVALVSRGAVYVATWAVIKTCIDRLSRRSLEFFYIKFIITNDKSAVLLKKLGRS
jgi:hypothetical protein